MNAMNKQYLSQSNSYEARLISLGNSGKTFIVECTDGTEPEYEGCLSMKEAVSLASKRTNDTGFAHGVFMIERDEDGDWFTTYERI